MKDGQKTGGRQKGTPNKVSAQVRENFLAVFTRLGGTAAMAEWAKANQSEFYKLYARLLPSEATVTVAHADFESLTDAELARIATGSSEALVVAEDGPQEPSALH